MNINNLLKKLRSKNITVGVIDDRLDVKAPKGAMTPELLSQIKEHKQELLSFLMEYDSGVTKTNVIPKIAEKSSYLLSSSQHRLWLLQQIENSNGTYNMPSVFSIKGNINIQDLEKAFLKLIERHEILRTNIIVEKETGTPKQVIASAETYDFKLNHVDVSEDEDKAKNLPSIINKDIGYNFDLERDTLFRVSLIKKSDDDYVLVSVMHHIISDGWSSSVMISDLFSLYQSISKEEKTGLEPLSIQYKDFAEWQQSTLEGDSLNEAKAYWINQFKEEVQILDITSDKLRSSIKTYNGSTIEKRFEGDVIQGLEKVCKAQGATLFMGLLSAVKVLFYKYTNQTDIVIGSPFAGRENAEVQNQIGFYVNTVGLRSTVKKEDNFIAFLNQVKKTTFEAYAHQNYPFDELIKELDLRVDRSRNPLFDIVLKVDVQNDILAQSSSLQSLIIEEISLDDTTSKFDLEFAFRVDDESSKLLLTYNTDIYNEDFVSQLSNHLGVILENIIINPQLEIEAIPFITAKEKATLISVFNNTEIDYQSKGKTYIDVFEEQVKKAPNNIAIVSDGKELTYLELDELSNQFAHFLINKYAIQLEDLVGVKLERSDWLIVSFLAVLKTGGAYLPIDLEYPEERISFIESDSNCKVIIDSTIITEFKNEKIITKSRPQIQVDGSNLVYAIYTSGSTGTPKGTLIEHDNLLNLCSWHIDEYDVNSSSRATLYSGIAFDASIWEMAPYLIAGATLFPILDQTTRLDLNVLKSFFEDHKITHSYLPTSICHELVNEDFRSEYIKILTGGDTLKINKAPKFKLYNNYGPTEYTVVTTSFDLQHDYTNSIPIGKPISNTRCYILDENLSLLPIGVSGELYISGAGVARGYLNNPKLTAERFIPNPSVEGERMYDTGDMAKWLFDGNIEFLGRKDSQVKIRGYRIELEEIENTIVKFSDAIGQVVLQVKETEKESSKGHPQAKELVAYYVAKFDIDKSELRAFLQERLPSYMVPSYYMELATMPLTANGKIDKKSLPAVTSEALVQNIYVAPRNEIEEALVAIWQEVLDVERIGVTDNFFELGGHSLLVGQVINRIYKQLNRTVTFKSFFENPIIEALGKELSSRDYNAIPQIASAPYYPLTTAQHRIWVLSQLEGGSVAYNMQGAVVLKGDLDVPKFEKAFNELIKRHEILRTNFKANESGEIHQYITEEDSFGFNLEEKDARSLTEVEIEKLLGAENAIAFDLANGLLLRAVLLKKANKEHVFSLTMHHIIGDGWSMELLISEVISIYNNLVQGKESDLPELQIQYKDYAVWLQSELTKVEHQTSKAYWLSQFRGELSILDLPSFKNRPKIQTYNGKTLTHRFSISFLEKLKAFSRTKDATLFMTLMSGINALLYRYSGQDDIIVGTPIAGREHPDLEGQIGLYLNTLAIRTRIEESYSILDLLDHQKQTLLSAYEHQSYPFDELVNKLNLTRDTSRSPLFDIMVVLQSQAQLPNTNKGDNLEGIQVENYEVNSNTAQFDVTFTFLEKEDLELSIEYNTDIYNDLLIERMFTHYENLMSQAIDNSNDAILSIDYISKQEKKQLVEDFNNTAIDYPKDKTIVELFETQVIKTPDNTAIVFENKELTYSELNEQSNQLAQYLRKQYDIQAGDLIGIKLERSELLVLAILGILKSGAAYVPIDISYPQERINFIENDIKCKVVIDQGELNRFFAIKDDYGVEKLKANIKLNDLAYVMYTSGTTGIPKGVMVEHSNVANLIYWFSEKFDISESTVSLQLTDISFDPSIEDIFSTLTLGGVYHIISKEVLLDIERLRKYIEVSKVSILNYLPGFLDNLLSNIPKIESIKTVISGGEALPEQIKKDLLEKGYNLYNNYGPTEIAVDALSSKTSMYPVTLGKPIANVQTYILSQNLSVQPVGVVGELVISGAGVARGYLNQSALSKEKFVPNPFIEGERMYKSGDIACWLPNGEIKYLGRKDSQVKIRGNRIELQEIENTILQFSDAIQQVVVHVKETDKGFGNGPEKGPRREKELVGYYIANAEIDHAELRAYLQEQLPSYMVPSYYAMLDVMPLTPNGKIDKKALPTITSEALIQNEYVAPRNEIEKELVKIWEETLDVEKIGVTDNFFELGGHSLLVGQVINRIYSQLESIIKFKTFFENPTIEGISRDLSKSDYISILQTAAAPYYPLTTSQHRIWVLSQLEGGDLAYNMPGAVALKGDLDIVKFEAAFKRLLKRHEILRTNFRVNESGEIHQYIAESVAFEFDYLDTSTVNRSNQEIEQILEKEYATVFDLENDLLVRASLFRIKENEHVFSLIMHHIIGDGWSMELLMSEVISVYNNMVNDKESSLPKLAIQYKDYAVWLKSELTNEQYKNSETYWLSQFQGELPILDLPSFKKRPKVQTFNGKTLTRSFSKPFLDQLKAFSKSRDATLFMTLMSGINTLLYRYTNQNDIVIGTPIAGREHPDLEGQIGLYLNTLAIRSNIEASNSFLDVLEHQKQTLLSAYDHQSYPFDELVNKLNLKRDTSRSVLFDVLVVLQNQEQLHNLKTEDTLAGIQIEDFEIENTKAKFDLSFGFFENEGLELSIEYNTDIYDDFLIERIFDHFENLLNYAISNPHVHIQSIPFLAASELESIASFNDTKVEYDKEITIIDLFEAQVNRTPDKVAVVCQGRALTYEELYEKSNQVAHYLLSVNGLSKGDFISICVSPTEYLIIVLLGILKSGFAYLIMDIEIPEERLNFILEDSQSKLLINDAFISKIKTSIPSLPKGSVDVEVNLDDVIYLMYTSGSTGTPKGAINRHEGFLNTLRWYISAVGINEQDKVGVVSNLSFDLTQKNYFAPLLTGASIHVNSDVNIIGSATSFISDNNISIINCAPSVFYFLLEQDHKTLDSLRKVILGGESINFSLIKSFIKNDNVEIYNSYGPSEASDVTTYYQLSEHESSVIPIGKPVRNTQNYILDSYNNPVPLGVLGEICIGGVGVGLGYLNNEKLTSEKFINTENFGRIYKTGDFGRVNVKNEIEFIGRKDNQIKIRGNRIELEEVENKIQQIDTIIKQAVVDVKTVNSTKVLVAYLVCTVPLNKSKLREELRRFLPDYMIPSYFIEMEEIPLSPNGKINRKALPDINKEDVIQAEYVPPSSEKEKILVAIWQEVLKIDKIGITNNFFELGGNSLSASLILHKIYKKTDVKLKLKEIFKYTTIASLTQRLSEVQQSEDIEQRSSSGFDFDLATPPQKRLYFLQELDKKTTAYNMPIIFKIKDQVDPKKLKDAFTAIVNDHEILRTYFRIKNSELEQITVEIPVVKIEYYTITKAITEDSIIESFIRPFDLSYFPIYRLAVVKKNKNEHLVLFDFHHILLDGISINIVFEDFIAHYQGQKIEKEIISYKQAAQRVFVEDNEACKIFWKNYLMGYNRADLPLDNNRSIENRFKGAIHNVKLEEHIVQNVRSLSANTNCSIFQIFITVVSIWLSRIQENNEVLLGVPISGRENILDENVAGLFVNTLPLRVNVDSSMSISDQLIKVKDNVLNTLEYQDLQFDEILEVIGGEREHFRNPIFDVMVSYEITDDSFSKTIENVEEIEYKGNSSILDLAIAIFDLEDSISFTFEYNSALFNKDTVEKFSQDLINILSIDHDQITSEIQLNTYETNTDVSTQIKVNDQPKIATPISNENEVFDHENLYNIWKRFLKQSTLDHNEDFFDLGGDSLRALLMIDKLNQSYNITVDINDFFEDTTLNGLSLLIKAQLVNDDVLVKSPSNLFRFRDDNNKNKLFFIHDVSGDVNSYYHLTDQLPNSFDVYGLSFNTNKTNVYPVNTTVEEIASRYVTLILNELQDDNSLYITGWSAGAIIAFEVVRQLEIKKKKIKNLVLIDAGLSKVAKNNSFVKQEEIVWIKDFAKTDFLDDQDLIQYMTMEELWLYTVNKLELDADLFTSMKNDFKSYKRLFPSLDANTKANNLFVKLNTIRTINQSIDNYNCNDIINSNTTIIKATQSDIDINLNKWKKLTKGAMNYVELEGDHFSIIKHEKIRDLILESA